MTKEEWGKLWELFHSAWGDCRESPEYNKERWKDMQHMLQKEQDKQRESVCI